MCAHKPAPSFCNPINQQRLAAAAKLALAAIDTYADVVAHGGDVEAALAHAQKLVADLTKLIAAIEAGK